MILFFTLVVLDVQYWHLPGREASPLPPAPLLPFPFCSLPAVSCLGLNRIILQEDLVSFNANRFFKTTLWAPLLFLDLLFC